jgi:hypothetical protein
MNILAIDLGTQMGWARSTRDGAVMGGSESFAARRTEGPGQRWLKFRQFLIDVRKVDDIHVCYYEDVKRHGPGVQAAHVYGGLLAMLQVWGEVNRVRLVPVGVGTIKKHWTGKGNADKAAMIDEAKRRGHAPADDNHADALAILSYAREQEGKPAVLPF